VTRVTSIVQLFPLLPTKGIIALDGVDGAGKSTLARQIADTFSASWFEVDAYIKEKRGIENYTSGICYSNLSSHVVQDTSELKIIDGVFLREILKNSRLTCTIYIFCSSYSQYGEYQYYGYRDYVSVETNPASLAYKTYFSKYNLPESADVFYAWKSN